MSQAAGASTRRPRGAGWREQLPTLALILLGGVLYARGLVLGFVGDDLTSLDAALRHPLGELLGGRQVITGTYRPLSRELYFWWWGRVMGLGPGGLHLLNLLVYAAAVAMIARLAASWAGPRAGRLAAAALVLFPPGSALLSWVSCAQDLIGLFWAAAALLLYRLARPLAAGLAVALAALSIETALVLPAVLAVMDVLARPRASWRERSLRLAPAAAGAVAALALAVAVRSAVTPAAAFAPWTLGRLGDAWRLVPGLARAFVPPDTGAGIARAIEQQPVWMALAAALAALAVPRGHATARPAPAGVAVRGGARTGGAADLRALLVVGAALALLGLLPLALLREPWRGYSLAIPGAGVSLAAGALLGAGAPMIARVLLPLLALVHFGAGGLYRARESAAGTAPHPYVNYAFFRDTGAFTHQLLTALEPWCASLRALPRTFAAGVPPDPMFTSALGAGLRVTCRDTVTRVRFLADFAPEDAATAFGVLRFDPRTVRFVLEPADARVRARIGEGFLVHARHDVAAACFESATSGRPPDRELSYPLAVSLAATGRAAEAREVWRQAVARRAVLDPATMAGRLLGQLAAADPSPGRGASPPRSGAADTLAPLAAAVLRAPWEAAPHRALGRALLARGRGREATLELSAAAGIGREMADLAWLGQGFEAIGAEDEALAAYRRALESGLPGELYTTTRDRFVALSRRAGAMLDRPQTRP